MTEGAGGRVFDPCAESLAYSSIPVEEVLPLRAKPSYDLLWSAEQILKASICGAVLLWQKHVRADSRSRLARRTCRLRPSKTMPTPLSFGLASCLRMPAQS